MPFLKVIVIRIYLFLLPIALAPSPPTFYWHRKYNGKQVTLSDLLKHYNYHPDFPDENSDITRFNNLPEIIQPVNERDGTKVSSAFL